MKPVWVVAMGLVLALLAAFALLSREPARESATADAPLGDIRDDSRAAMRDLLRDAEKDRQ